MSRDDGERALVEADGFLVANNLTAAASALDRAYGHLPGDDAVASQRKALLDDLAVEEHGLVWRYIPAGSFLMGSHEGDPDERPVHERHVDAFWMTDVPITWTAYCRLMGWSDPPNGWPPRNDPSLAATDAELNPEFILNELGKIRRQYCESKTRAANDWHRHLEEARQRTLAFDDKPLVAASAYDAEDLAAVLTARSSGVSYGLPTEAEWEKAARGGLIGCRWSWGNERPTPERCDFGRFGAFHLESPRRYPANGYGLRSMCGGVAEWTADPYDALAYRRAKTTTPPSPSARVLRGGSWADCAEAVTVSFRTSFVQSSWRAPEQGQAWGAPTVGFRLVRRGAT